jgi:hypothetical protein
VTFSASDWRLAQEAWLAGEFGSEWDEARAAARSRGFIFPPSGSRHDDWDDEHPSQRAIVYRAIEESPRLLLRCVARSRSWSDVVRMLAGERDAWRVRNARSAELDAAAADAGPTREEAAGALRSILGRLAR